MTLAARILLAHFSRYLSAAATERGSPGAEWAGCG